MYYSCHATRSTVLYTLSLHDALPIFTLQQLQLLQHNQPPPPPLPAVTPPTALARSYGLIGESTAMQRVYQLIGKVLHNPVTVLITGETGTGKELVARAIHDYGSRRSEN